MWPTGNTLLIWWQHGMRVVWVVVVLCVSACTTPGHFRATPSVLTQEPARYALDRLLTRGDIQVAEARLKDFGFDPGLVDGQFTTQTQAAVRAFQARYGFRVSGLLDHATRLELLPGLDQDEFDP